MAVQLSCPTCGALFRRRMVMCPLDGGNLAPLGADPRVDSCLDGAFRIEARLGETSTASLYLATELATGLAVHVRFLFGELAASPMRCMRFLRGARVADLPRHPNVLHVHAVGYDRGIPYVVTEAFPGRTVEAWVRERGPLQGTALRTAVVSVCAGLNHLHRHRLIHTRLGPTTVLVDEALGYRIAGLRDAVPVGARGRTPSGVAESMRYLAPEFLAGEPVDERTDLFSLGALIHYLCTGRSPEGVLSWSPSCSLEKLAVRLMDVQADQRTLSVADVEDLVTVCE